MVDAHRRQLNASGARPAETIGTVSRMLGDGASREYLGNPIQPTITRVKKPRTFETALQRMKKDELIRGDIPPVKDVPEAVQTAAALLIEASMDAFSYRRAALAGVADPSAEFQRETTSLPNSDDAVVYQRQMALSRNVEMSYMYAAAQELTTAAVEAKNIIGASGQKQDYKFEIDTEWGKISLTGGNVNVHDGGPTFIAIDTSGDDTWVNPACNQTLQNWASFCIDTQGKDFFVSHPALKGTAVAAWQERSNHRGLSGPCSAAFGISAICDSEGDDVYRTARSGLGSALFGVAYLLDDSGDDFYDAYAEAEGYGRFGIGILEDRAGKDIYQGFSQVQGCGSPRGAGVLLDRLGDDTYTANDQVIDFASPQSPEHNLSMSQGAGVGFRSDYLNGRSQAGGLGILLDSAGSDRYSCGVYGQGVGYWMGTGLLLDNTGDDTYEGFWYSGGVGALFGVGYLEDIQGKDQYTGARNANMGVGFDFAVGMFIEGTGDDKYTTSTLSLGASSENGIGVFVDQGGVDTYACSGLSMGQSSEASKNSLRERALAVGLFLDLEGLDKFPTSVPFAKNQQQSVNWRDKLPIPSESQVGVFLDR